MPFDRSAFHLLLKPLDRRVVGRAVAAHAGDHGVGAGDNGWSCARHRKALLFGQLAGLQSLPEIVEGLAGQRAALYHLNLRAPCRSTLADANRGRPAAVYGAREGAGAGGGGRTERRDGGGDPAARCPTPIPLKDQRLAWAEASARTRWLKLHLLYDPRQRRPVWFELTSAKVKDVVAGRAAPLEPGATPVFDKGYTDYRWWFEIRAAGAFFVIQRKRNAHCRVIADPAARGDAIQADRRIKIGHRQPRGGAPKNPLFDVVLREITVARPDKDEPLYLLTNDLERPAAEIARLYKERWDIELLFKWLKQNLKTRRFLGRSENAVRIQIYVALIAFMLLRILHQTTARSVKASTALLLTRIKIGLFRPLDPRQIHKTPPRPPSLRPPHPQYRLAFQ